MGVWGEQYAEDGRDVARLRSADDQSGIFAMLAMFMSHHTLLVVSSLSCFVNDCVVWVLAEGDVLWFKGCKVPFAKS